MCFYQYLILILSILAHIEYFLLQGVSGNSVYSIPNAELLLSIDLSIVEFPRENLRFVEVLGEGQFGEVCVASIV